MILVDPREPQELLDLVKERVNGNARYTRPQLNSGDFCFTGNGPTGEINVGIEVKKLQDLLAAERSGRYVCQLTKMMEEYDVCVLIIEGVFRPGESGFIETYTRGGWGVLNLSTRAQREARTRNNDYRYYSELDNFETSLCMKKDVVIKCSGSRLHTAWRIVNLYNWFQRAWESHDSTEQVKIQAGIITRRASYVRMVAAQLPRIGWNLSGKVEKHFGSIDRMINSLPSEWEEIPGIGRNTALEICKVIKERSR